MHPGSGAATSEDFANVNTSAVRLTAPWPSLVFSTAVLAAGASAVGLLRADRIYERETAVLRDTVTAQDIVTLLVISPLLILLAWRARHGSLTAYVCLPGVLAFTTYNYVIYALSIHSGPLFLVWVAILGLSIFSLVGQLSTADTSEVKHQFLGRAMPGTGWFLIAVAALFALLWLSEIVPDLLAGDASRSASDWKVPTNPVHVLDLTFFLPAVMMSGILLLRRHPLGYATAAGQLTWLALTCLPILITPFVANARDHSPGWVVMVPMGGLLLAVFAVLGRLLAASSQRARRVDVDP